MTIQQFIESYEESMGRRISTGWAICGHCRGNGTTVDYLGEYTQSDREEMGEEWFEFSDDIRAGHYDRSCGECGGTGKVRTIADAGVAQEWQNWCADEAADRATMRAESGWQ